MLEGWLERLVRETTVEPLVLPDIVTDHWTATPVMPESLACDPLIEAWRTTESRLSIGRRSAYLDGRAYRRR